MAVDAIHDTITGLLGMYTTPKSAADEASEAESNASNVYSTGGDKKYSDSLEGQIRKQVDEMLEGVPYTGNKLTMQDVINYRDSKREQLEETIRADLDKLGVDLDQDIDLAYDSSSGLVYCSSDHPDADLINRYFKANPELCEEYADALKLSRMTSLAEEKMSPSQMRSALQQQAVSLWWEESGAGSQTTLMGSLGATSGLEAYKGLNLSV